MRLAYHVAIIALSGSAIAIVQASAPSEDSEKVVCKSSAKTGTRFKSKTCRTRAQWERMAELAKRSYGETQNRPVIEIRKGN